MNLGKRVLLMSALVLAAACGKNSENESSENEPAKPPKETVSPEAMAKAKEVYTKRCAVCHGETGNSDGPSAKTLKPLPAKFTDPKWQLATSDDAIEAIIKKGGAAVDKSLLMPPNADLSGETVRALRLMIRDFAN